MSSRSPGNPASRSARAIVLVLWAGLFLTLLLTLPRWSLRVRCIEPVTPQIVTDDSSTLIAFSVRLHKAPGDATYYPTWPIRLIDLSTGRERVLTRDGESAEVEQIRDEFGSLYFASGRQTLHTIDEENGIPQSGDYLALTYETIDETIPEKRLQVVNWRSGEVMLDRQFEGNYEFFGPRLLVAQHNGGSRLEIWTPAEKAIETADWLPRFHELDSMIVSPDGRWLILRGATGLWDLTRREERFKLPDGVEEMVFSPDGSKLVLVDRFEQGEPGYRIRRWRCLDPASGALLREEQERLEWPDNRSPPRDPGYLHFLSDGQTVRYDQRGGATEWSPQGLRREDDPEGEEDEDLDLPHVTGEWTVAVAPDTRWAVSSVEPRSVLTGVYERIASMLGVQEAWSSGSPFSYGLWSLGERGRIASLGRGSVERCWFTPDSLRVITQSDRELLIWDVPPRLPWGRAAVWLLAVPITAGVWRLLRAARSRRFVGRGDKQ